MEARQIEGKGKWSKEVGDDNRKMRTTEKGEKGN